MFTNGQIEHTAASVVREYLSRKGFKSTLMTMDTELPRTEESISNRAQLAKELHIEKIMKKNKESSKPFRSMIEVIVKFLVEKTLVGSSKDCEGVPEQRSSTDVSRTEKKSSRPSSARRKESSEHRKRTDDAVTPTKSSSDVYSSQEAPDFSGLPQQDVSPVKLHREPTTIVTMKDKPNARRLDEPDLTKDLRPTIVGESPISERITGSSSAANKEADHTKRSKRPGSASRSRGLAGPITSSLDVSDRRGQKHPSSRSSISVASPNTSTSLDAGRDSSLLDPSPLKKETSSSSRSKLKNFGFDLSPENTSENLMQDTTPTSKAVSGTKENDDDDALISSRVEGRPSSRQRRSIDESNDSGSIRHGSSRTSSRHSRHDENKKSSSLSSGSQIQKKTKEVSSLGDLEMGDVDDLVDDLRDVQLGSYTPSGRRLIDSRPITLQLAMQLKTVLFGSATGCFSDEWRLQGFGFSEIADLPYGLVQHKGGPCGILASLQACMLQRLLFAEGSTPTAATLKQISAKKRTDCLVQAICDIVWRAGQKRNAVIALPSSRAYFPGGGCYKSDGLTETITLNLFKTRDETQEFLQANIRTFAEGRGCGCILLLYSTLFSRTIEMVIEDMDEPTNKIIGQHGYCTQEMVNLILTGKAVSNVFNDVVELGSGKEVTRLKGLSGRSDVGLLSLFEHYQSCQVGTYYKTPRHPIWVVCSESHFSVFFSLKQELMSDWRVERHFDLYYYDGLAKQLEEIRLTIETTQSCPSTDNDDLVPPLELCIRTKWPEAVVNWNGSEPIL